MTESPFPVEVSPRFERFVPRDFLRLLGLSDFGQLELGDQIEKKMTVMFSDIRNFTTLSESLGPQPTFAFLNEYLGLMVPLIRQHGGFVDKYIGDAILALFPGGEQDALQAALAMLSALQTYNHQRHSRGLSNLGIGIGLNTGLVVLGTIGTAERMETTVIGDTVNLASRLESLCKVFQTPLLISEHTLHGLSEPQRRCVRFVDRTRVKGKFRPESVYEAFGHLPADQIARRQACLENFEQGVAYYHLRAIERAQPLFEDCLRQCPEDSVALRYLARCQAWQTQGVFEGTGELELELPWLPEYNLGIPEIDAQHQQLWARTLQLLQAVHHERTADWEELLDFLQDYITLHFKTEDAFMQRYAYPFIDEHHQEHRAFIESYQHLRQEIQSGRHDSLYLLFQIDLFLVDWLINHTTKIDRHWGQYILQAGYPAT